MKTWMRPLGLTLALGLATGACDDGATDPSATDDAALLADVAMVAADGMFQDLAHMQSPGIWGGFGAAPGAEGIEIQGSTSFTRTVTFFPENSYDPLTTTHMEIVSDLTRQVTHTFWSADIARHREMTVSGLEGEETQRTWNGTATGDVFRSRHPEGGSERTYDMDSQATITDVVRGVPRAENPYPLSGTITREIHLVLTKDGETEERHITTVITFDGDQYVTLDVDGTEYEVNLAERGVKGRFRKGG